MDLIVVVVAVGVVVAVVVAVGVAADDTEGRLKALGCEFMQADFKGPALDSAGFVQRYG